MERRDVSKTDLKSCPQATPVGPDLSLDLFGIDLDSELPSVNQQKLDPQELLPLGDDPFAEEYQLADLSSGMDDPFANLPVIIAEVVDAPVLATAVTPGASGSNRSNNDGARALVAAASVSVMAIPVTATSAASVESPEETTVTQADLVRRRFYVTALPSWAISLGVHVAVLFLLAALSMDPIRESIGLALDAGGGNDGETLDDTELPGPAESGASESPAPIGRLMCGDPF